MGFDTAIANLEKGLQLAETIAKSGIAPVGFDKYKIFAVMLKGRELNIPPMQSLTSLYVVNGKVAMDAQTMLAVIYRSSQFEGIVFREEPNSFTTTMKRKGKEPVSYTFTMDDAAKMQTSKQGGGTMPLVDKFNWKTMPKIMLKWRSISGCARMAFPDVIMGLYTPDELGAIETGEETEHRVVIEFDEAFEYERMLNILKRYEKECTKEDLDSFLEQNKIELEKLSDKKVGILRPIFEKLYSKFNKPTIQPEVKKDEQNPA
jgi:hypothetical protein